LAVLEPRAARRSAEVISTCYRQPIADITDQFAGPIWEHPKAMRRSRSQSIVHLQFGPFYANSLTSPSPPAKFPTG
jgi:hypothetical protein